MWMITIFSGISVVVASFLLELFRCSMILL